MIKKFLIFLSIFIIHLVITNTEAKANVFKKVFKNTLLVNCGLNKKNEDGITCWLQALDVKRSEIYAYERAAEHCAKYNKISKLDYKENLKIVFKCNEKENFSKVTKKNNNWVTIKNKEKTKSNIKSIKKTNEKKFAGGWITQKKSVKEPIKTSKKSPPITKNEKIDLKFSDKAFLISKCYTTYHEGNKGTTLIKETYKPFTYFDDKIFDKYNFTIDPENKHILRVLRYTFNFHKKLVESEKQMTKQFQKDLPKHLKNDPVLSNLNVTSPIERKKKYKISRINKFTNEIISEKTFKETSFYTSKKKKEYEEKMFNRGFSWDDVYESLVINLNNNTIKFYQVSLTSKKYDFNRQEMKCLNNSNDKSMMVKNNNSPRKIFNISQSNRDNQPPKLIITKTKIVSDNPEYTIKVKVIDQSQKKFVKFVSKDSQIVLPTERNGTLELKKMSLESEEIKVIAIDQWGNRSDEQKIQFVFKQTESQNIVKKYEPLKPSAIKNRVNTNNVALIIGLENYKNAPKALYANLDAKAFYQYARNTFGIDNRNIKIITDNKANLIETLKALNKWLPTRIKPNQTNIYIFFAGHGLASPDGEELYLLTHDSDSDLLRRTALSLTEIYKEIEKFNPQNVNLFLDTCYSGISRNEETLMASARPIRVTVKKSKNQPTNFNVFTAAQNNEVSSGLSNAKHGIFSYYLMKGLEGGADADKDRKITNQEMQNYLSENVSLAASQMSRKQNPSFSGDPSKILLRY